MLPVTREILDNPAYEPFVRVCHSILLRTEEVAKHWRMATQSLHNARRLATAPPSIKIGNQVRYRMSEILRIELNGQRGGWTFERVSLALATMPGLSVRDRQEIEQHLLRVLG